MAQTGAFKARALVMAADELRAPGIGLTLEHAGMYVEYKSDWNFFLSRRVSVGGWRCEGVGGLQAHVAIAHHEALRGTPGAAAERPGGGGGAGTIGGQCCMPAGACGPAIRHCNLSHAPRHACHTSRPTAATNHTQAPRVHVHFCPSSKSSRMGRAYGHI